MTSNTPETVRFDVGGTKYRVSRSTIELWPDTMLARLISDEWNDGDTDKEIFIDRNGERFQFVLDYMRDQKVHLPMTIAKDAVLQELEYFGFDAQMAASALKVGPSSFESTMRMATSLQSYQKDTARIGERIEKLSRTTENKVVDKLDRLWRSSVNSFTNLEAMIQQEAEERKRMTKELTDEIEDLEFAVRTMNNR